MVDCIICGDTFNKSTRLQIECSFCYFNACRCCWQRWFLSENITKCMSPNCGKEWTRKYLSETMTKTFIVNDLKTHRENILFDKERALFPATQIVIGKYKEIDNIEQEKSRLDEEIRRLRLRQVIITNRQYEIRREIGRGVNRQRVEFIRACPDENCRGFLSTQWKCGVCDKWTCPECHEIKGLERDCEHTCNTDNIETAKLLSKDTKSCPSCGYGIYKIDGCDQMWCTQCHVAFSFRTGRVEHNIHNPHYYEYMRQNGGMPRNPLDNPCGQELNHHMVTHIRQKIRADEVPYLECISRTLEWIIRHIIHISEVEIPHYNTNYEMENQQFRILYMQNKITEVEYKTKIQRNDKKYQKRREISNVFQLIVTSCTDIIYRLIEAINHKPTCRNPRIIIDILKEIDVLYDYSDSAFKDIGKTYGHVPLKVSDYFRKSNYEHVLRCRQIRDYDFELRPDEPHDQLM